MLTTHFILLAGHKYKIVLIGGCQYVNYLHHQPLIYRGIHGQYFITLCIHYQENILLLFCIKFLLHAQETGIYT